MDCRLPAARSITVERSWSNAPALDSETEIELAVEHSAGTILECRLVDDLPDALVAAPATRTLRVFPRVRAATALQNRAARTRRCAGRSGLCSLCVHRSGWWSAGPWRRSSRQCAFIPRCGRARTRRSFSRAAARSNCSFARCASAAWGATSRACASISRATICATFAGRPQRDAGS